MMRYGSIKLQWLRASQEMMDKMLTSIAVLLKSEAKKGLTVTSEDDSVWPDRSRG
jgi:hypothetical protein